MAKTRLSAAAFVERGYGQVEPNHLSAQRTGQIYAQLPAAANIDVLENGQYVKYDYEKGVVDFTGPGEWMLVYNEIKLYRDHLEDNDFAMKKGDYLARVYSPVDGEKPVAAHARFYGAEGNDGKPQEPVAIMDPLEPSSTDDPFIIDQFAKPKYMPEGTRMVPRVFKTNIGDIYTTNTIKASSLAVGQDLVVGGDGYLTKASGTASGMVWRVVKVYTLPDRQKAVKIMRIA